MIVCLQPYYISREHRKEKYKYDNKKIEAYCKAIAKQTGIHIEVQVMRNGTARFVLMGLSSAVKKALRYTQGEFIDPKVCPIYISVYI